VSLASWFRNLLSPRPQPAQAEIGRNDICWCGSGKKYKKCHLKSDESKRMEDHYAARAAAARKQAGGGIVPGSKAKAGRLEKAAQPPVKR
jgi:hypothetical protein